MIGNFNTAFDLMQRGVNDLNVKDMREINRLKYRKQYWDACHCDQLPTGIDYAVFDTAEALGLCETAHILQEILCLQGCVDYLHIPVQKIAHYPDKKYFLDKLIELRVSYSVSAEKRRRIRSVHTDAKDMLTPRPVRCIDDVILKLASIEASDLAAHIRKHQRQNIEYDDIYVNANNKTILRVGDKLITFDDKGMLGDDSNQKRVEN